MTQLTPSSLVVTPTQQFWKSIAPIYEAICSHPFINKLTNGTLDQNCFIFYLQQDALYLVDFARALAITAARLSEVEHIGEFLSFSQGALAAERDLHEQYFKKFSVHAGIHQQPACFYYTNYLLATVSHRSVEEAVAALLPCFWIYAEVGKHIARSATFPNIYQEWIAMYSGEAFHAAVIKACEITDMLAMNANHATRGLMEKAFMQSARLEWLFWNGAYKLEQWPYC